MSLNLLDVDGFKALLGRGIRGVIGGREVKVVGPGYLRELKLKVELEEVRRILEEGKTIVFLLMYDELAALLVMDARLGIQGS